MDTVSDTSRDDLPLGTHEQWILSVTRQGMTYHTARARSGHCLWHAQLWLTTRHTREVDTVSDTSRDNLPHGTHVRSGYCLSTRPGITYHTARVRSGYCLWHAQLWLTTRHAREVDTVSDTSMDNLPHGTRDKWILSLTRPGIAYHTASASSGYCLWHVQGWLTTRHAWEVDTVSDTSMDNSPHSTREKRISSLNTSRND